MGDPQSVHESKLAATSAAAFKRFGWELDANGRCVWRIRGVYTHNGSDVPNVLDSVSLPAGVIRLDQRTTRRRPSRVWAVERPRESIKRVLDAEGACGPATSRVFEIGAGVSDRAMATSRAGYTSNPRSSRSSASA